MKMRAKRPGFNGKFTPDCMETEKQFNNKMDLLRWSQTPA
jgi:hypothetical protein